MRAYLSDYAKHLPAVIAAEKYQQRAGSGVRAQRRLLESDYGIVQLPGDLEWLGFREVLAVDGKPVPDSAHRLTEIFQGLSKSSERLSQARRIAEESARYNLGPIYRTINDPSFVLEFLDARNSSSHAFFKERRRDGRRHSRVGDQVSGNRPPDDHPDARQAGSARSGAGVDRPDNGRILRAEASVQPGFGAGNFIGTIDVTFTHDDKLGFAVPSKMTEKYTNRNLVVVSSGEATYSNYRRFTVDTEENVVVK